MAGKAPRNKTTRSRPARPVQKRYPETRMERGVLLLVGAVIAIAAVVVLAGLYITQYRPPRAHIMTIESTDYTAADIKRRGSYYVRYEVTNTAEITPENLVDKTIERLVRDQVLIRRAPSLVGEISDEDVDQMLRIDLGFATPTPTAAPQQTPPATATPAPVATPTAAVAPDPELQRRAEADFARAQRDLIRSFGVTRGEFRTLLEARLQQDRLVDRFRADIGSQAPQLRLQMIRVTDEAIAQRLREQAVQGADFVRLAAQNSVVPSARQDGGELGWRLLATLTETVRPAVESLPRGGVSPVLRNDRFYEIYRVAEPTTLRDVDAAQLNTLVDQRLAEWFERETPNVKVEQDLSEGEREWLVDAIVDDVSERGPVPTPTPAATAVSGG